MLDEIAIERAITGDTHVRLIHAEQNEVVRRMSERGRSIRTIAELLSTRQAHRLPPPPARQRGMTGHATPYRDHARYPPAHPHLTDESQLRSTATVTTRTASASTTDEDRVYATACHLYGADLRAARRAPVPRRCLDHRGQLEAARRNR